MINNIIFVTDDFQKTLSVAKAVGTRFRSDLVELTRLQPNQIEAASVLVFDIDLSDLHPVEVTRQKCLELAEMVPSIFLARKSNRLEAAQANALGARKVLLKPVELDALLDAISSLLNEATTTIWDQAPQIEKSALKAVDNLNNNMFAAIRSAQAVPKEEVHLCANKIAASLAVMGIPSWLDAVKKHHSYTFRHSMQVAGLSVAFGLHLGMKEKDVQRLAVSALMHDIGKARIPTEILDKPSELTEAEIREMRKHPEYGGEILAKDGQFDYEVLDVALHHHERLNGRGYPDRLQGDEIGDLVRMISVVDTFSALIDRRSYKAPRSKAEAYALMLTMGDELDIDFVRAFGAIALSDRPVIAKSAIAL